MIRSVSNSRRFIKFTIVFRLRRSLIRCNVDKYVIVINKYDCTKAVMKHFEISENRCVQSQCPSTRPPRQLPYGGTENINVHGR